LHGAKKREPSSSAAHVLKPCDIVIAGAGIAGVATAYHLSEHHGITDIVLVDPRPPLTLTSNKTGANYRDWWPVRPMVELASRSIQLMNALRKSGAPFTMNRRGYLYVSIRPEFPDAVPELLAAYRSAGLGPIRFHQQSRATGYQPATPHGLEGPDGADVLLDRGLIRRMFPHFSGDVTGLLHARNAGTVDTVALGQYLLASAMRRGARLVRGEVIRIDAAGGRISRVGISGEEGSTDIATRQFVNAAGPFAGRVAMLMGIPLPLINVLQQKIAVLDPLGAVPPEAPFTVSLDPRESMPAGLHIKPDTFAGKAVIKLGWAFNQQPEEPQWDPTGSAEFPELVLGAAAHLIPGLESYLDRMPLSIANEAGYYTRTPDDLPLIGHLGPEGAYLVAGLAGYGAMVACAAAEIVASSIAATGAPSWTAKFSPDRFSNPTYLRTTSVEKTSSGAL
jgi:glycine/D-amino acid oxidase-like deaminating enzyme